MEISLYNNLVRIQLYGIFNNPWITEIARSASGTHILHNRSGNLVIFFIGDRYFLYRHIYALKESIRE
jgi:hypothetical protein